MTEIISVTVGLILSHLAVAYAAVRLFLYGHLYGRHSLIQDVLRESPSIPTMTPQRAAGNPPTTKAPVANPQDLQENPFAEPSLGIPEVPNS